LGWSEKYDYMYYFLKKGMRGLLPLLVGQTPSPDNHAKLLFTTGIPSGLRSAYYIKI
jgi:hypothetical protein